MIWTYLILFLVSAFTQLLVVLHLQAVITLPTILGVDVDADLVQGVGIAHTFFNTFWPVYYMFIGALFILGYLVVKNIALRTFLGHRTPGH